MVLAVLLGQSNQALIRMTIASLKVSSVILIMIGCQLLAAVAVEIFTSKLTAAALIDRTDHALYAGNAAGRNRVVCEPDMATHA